ncbi:MAG: TetR/AcrR family transcriptional regulator [Pseudomonadota bacterium]
MTASPKLRLPAAERRQALLEAALRVFSQGSYAGATTAEIARVAGVSEPVLYRHFPSKKELYFACLDEAWARLKEALTETIERVGLERAPLAVAQTGTGLRALRVLPPNLWLSGIVESSEDPEIADHVRAHMREVHDFIADTLRRAQSIGVIPVERDPEAEAWIFVGGGLLVTMADRLGGLLGHEDFSRVATARYTWLFGKPPAEPPQGFWHPSVGRDRSGV